MIASKHSFRLVSKKKLREKNPDDVSAMPQSVAPLDTTESDNKKRAFIKLMGITGAVAAVSYLIPKKADALVFGSTPTSNIVGIKNASNVQINPAQEDGNLATIASQANLLTFDSGSNPANLKVNVAAIAPGTAIGLQNTSNVAVNPAQEDGNLASVATNTANLANLTFSAGALVTTSSGGGTSSVVGVEDSMNNRINPSSDDSLQYLRRMVKQMESMGTVDAANRQRVAVETAVITSGTITTVTTVGTINNVASVAGWGDQMFQDVARNAYANGIRQNLTFS